MYDTHSIGLQVLKIHKFLFTVYWKRNESPKAVQTMGTKMILMKKTISYKTNVAHYYRTYKQLLLSSVISTFAISLIKKEKQWAFTVLKLNFNI